jgi:hypothetical protein
MINDVLDESIRVRCVFREQLAFLISVDTPHVTQELLVAKAALDAGVSILGRRSACSTPVWMASAPTAPSRCFKATPCTTCLRCFRECGRSPCVQVVGGSSAEQAMALARRGLCAFVISGNLGLPDASRTAVCRVTKSNGTFAISLPRFQPPVERVGISGGAARL